MMMAIRRPARFCSYSKPWSQRQQNIEMGRLGGVQKLAVLEAGETSVLRRLIFVPKKAISQSLIHTLAEKNQHS